MNMLREWCLEKRHEDSEDWEISLYSGRVELFYSQMQAESVAEERNRINYMNCEWRVVHDY